MNSEEIWKDIIGYEGLYQVSSLGRVRSIDRYVKNGHSSYRLHKGKMLSPIKNKYGYLQVNLCYNRKIYKKYVHRLVAQAFIPNSDGLPQINHKDEDKTNNNVYNLEWCNCSYNINYGTRQDKVRDTAIKNGYWTGLSREEYKKKWYQENKDKAKEYDKKYYQENRDKICERQKENYRKKKEMIQNNA